jgi:hypothetical protein
MPKDETPAVVSQKKPRVFRVAHKHVGPLPQGRIVREDDDHLTKPGVDLQRLIDLGALVPSDEKPDEEPVPYGAGNPSPLPEKKS